MVASVLCPITAYCDHLNLEDTGAGLIAFAYDTINNITGMSYSAGDERLYDYISSSGEALGWKYLQYQTEQLANTPVPVLANRLFDIEVPNPVGDFAAERYHAAVVNRDYVDSIYESSNNFIRSGTLNSLDNFGISTQADINYDDNIIAHPPFYNPTNQPTGYLDITNAVNYNGVSVLSAPGIAPVMYVPNNVQVYLYDRLLPTDCIYVLISDNYLFECACNDRPAVLLYSYDNGSGKSFEVGAGYFNGYNGDIVQLTSWRVSNVLICTSSSSTNTPQYSNDTLSYIAQYQQHIGDTVLGEYPTVTPPSDIPYDNDGNVVVFVPSGRTYRPTEIIYYSPEDVKNYIDNSDIITTNYTTNLDENTYNDVVNNYNEYLNNPDSGFDDSNILSKLDRVIEWLRKIYNKITFTDIRSNPEFNAIFSDKPTYVNFSDSVFNNIPVVNEITSAIETAKTAQVNTGFEAPLYIAPDDGNILQKLFNGFTLNVSWYTPYRDKVYYILTIIVYGMGIVSCINSVKSVFGISSEGGV